MQTLKLRVPRDSQIGPEAAVNLFSSLSSITSYSFFKTLLSGKKTPTLAFEILVQDQTIYFQVASDPTIHPYLQSQILAQYPNTTLSLEKKPIPISSSNAVGKLKLNFSTYYPLKNYLDFKDIDPISTLLTVLSKAQKGEQYLIQLLIKPTSGKWISQAQALIAKGVPQPDGHVKNRPDQRLIEDKIQHLGFAFNLHLVAPNQESLTQLANSFGGFSRGDANSLKLTTPGSLGKKTLLAKINQKNFSSGTSQVLNINELATLWHLPTDKVKIPNIAWAEKVFTEPPENLPVVTDTDNETKSQIAVFAETRFKNQQVKFGIKQDDRRRHVYLIGKTGTGKSTTIANMAIDDMKKNKGMAIIDPHGDLCETILDYVPKNRLNDVCYFNPADLTRPVRLNPLEVTNPAQAELVASGIISIFYKLYHFSWGPRMEHILRNTLLTLVSIENTTLLDVTRILTDKNHRAKLLEKINDKMLLNFWHNEFDKMNPNLQTESISPILNKVGQFVTSPLIRRVLEQPKSTVNLEEFMNEGKILIVNLSQGKLGEDNAALLGAMFITKLQLAAMSRVEMAETDRKDFYLYVDEFQNFATQSFIKILSEARKYRLNLMLANQYIGQLDIEIQKAIFGNAGTLLSFAVGSQDSQILHKEFGEAVEPKDLINLSNFQVLTRLTIDNHISQPFLAKTLPLPSSINQNRAKVVKNSQERYGK